MLPLTDLRATALGKDSTVTRRMIVMVLAVASLLLIGGCASQEKHDELRGLYRRSQEQVEYLRAQLDEANARIAALTAAGAAPDAATLRQLERALAERDAALAALAEAEHALRQLGRMGGPVLDPETDAALVDLARRYPDLMTYDPELGMVRFQSDLTFALGSVEVQPNAVTSLRRLAEILNSEAASRYEVRVIGHTDNVPISRAETRAQHSTNWHLSAHRAIAVKDVLVGARVSNPRIMVAGAGEHRPIAPNVPRTGNQANRRVEIYLVPMSAAVSAAVQAAPATPATPTAPAAPAQTQPQRTQPDVLK
jgi:chemotaxis protein MotB